MAQGASAGTVVLSVTGGGIDAGSINDCTAANTCGSTTAYGYTSGGNVSGTITLNTSGTTGTATFNFQLTSTAQFTGGEQLTAGTFISSTTIPIQETGGEWSQTGSPVYGSNSGVTFSTLTPSENAPQISSLYCVVGTLDVCGLFLGPTGFEMTDSSGNTYDANLGFDLSARVVPLPSSAWLMLSGIAAGVGTSVRRRRMSVS